MIVSTIVFSIHTHSWSVPILCEIYSANAFSGKLCVDKELLHLMCITDKNKMQHIQLINSQKDHKHWTSFSDIGSKYVSYCCNTHVLQPGVNHVFQKIPIIQVGVKL